jgi:dTDP-4-dehydrorhamnose reductase
MVGGEMTVLVTGGYGLLGSYLLRELRLKNIEALGTSHKHDLKGMVQMDLTSDTDVGNVLHYNRPDVIVNTASIGNVDFVERYPEESYDVNVEGVRRLINGMREYGIEHLIHISSNAVFSGVPLEPLGNNLGPPYSDADEMGPVNLYGAQKAEADRAVMQSGLHWTIVRPILMYGWPTNFGRHNVVTKCIEVLRNDGVFRAADNVVTQPLFVRDCARYILKEIRDPVTGGVTHIAGPETVTIYDFMCRVALVFNLPIENIMPVGIEDLCADLPAIRPLNTTFKMDWLHRRHFYTTSVETGLRIMKYQEAADTNVPY